ncbi:hypothetical protein LPMP_020070 [Leishmania panamensis]|uniref:hypothetical protein n=1 Tax=Leishmania panamensis TaxID=5679 RepID=UPI0004F6F898|nr:hypothetical protein LPMP_020070 [Leishmania panamensis]AIN95187.1 hypothetical protein LPMP_020070 [Leishmania panamensis]
MQEADIPNPNLFPLGRDGGWPWPRQHGSVGQSGTSSGDAAGHGGRIAAPLSGRHAPVASGASAADMRGMAHCSPQPRAGGLRSAARGVAVKSSGDDDPLNVNTSSTSSSTTSLQWRRHNPYRTASTTTSSPAHSPRACHSGSPLALPGSLADIRSSGSAPASPHLNAVLNPHASRSSRGAASDSEAPYRLQPASPSRSGHDPGTFSPKAMQARETLSRTSSAVSCLSSHYSCSDQRHSSNTGLLPDVGVVTGATSSSGVFLMHTYQFHLDTHDQSGAASSSATAQHSYTTMDHFFEETGGFPVDADFGADSYNRRRSGALRSSPDDMGHHQRSGGTDSWYDSGGTAPPSLNATARHHTPGQASLRLSGIGWCARVSLPKENVRGQSPIDSVGASGTAGADTSIGQTGSSAVQGPHRLTKPPSAISSTEAMREWQQAWLSAEPNDSDGAPTMPSYMDPILTPPDLPEVEQCRHAHNHQHHQYQPQRKPNASPAAPSPVISSAATPGFTVSQLTELLEAHRGRTHGGGGKDEAVDEVRCPAGSQFSVYDSGMRRHYLIKSEQVAITRGAIKYASLTERYGSQTRFRFQLCNRYLHHRCSSAAECQYIHSLFVSTATQVHVNENGITTYGVRQMIREELAGGRNTLEYPTITPGIVFAVYPPNQLNSFPQFILSELILQTEGAVQTSQALSGDAAHGAEATIVRPRHCAHFQFKRMCNLGASCRFIHSLVPFVQGLVNQPPLPACVNLNALSGLAAGGVFPSAVFDGNGREAIRGGGGAGGTSVAVPRPIRSQCVLSVWPNVVGTAQEAALSPLLPPPPALLSRPAVAMARCGRMNAVYETDDHETQIAPQGVPQYVNSTEVCAAGAPLYPTVAPIDVAEVGGESVVVMPPPHEKQHGATAAVGLHGSCAPPPPNSTVALLQRRFNIAQRRRGHRRR